MMTTRRTPLPPQHSTRTRFPWLAVAMICSLSVPALVACGTTTPAEQQGDAAHGDGGTPSSSSEAACEAHCRHVGGCYGDSALVAQCTRDVCGLEGSWCEDEARAMFECVTNTSCDAILEADFCADEEVAWNACEVENGGSSSGGEGWDASSGDASSSSGGWGETWGCSYESRSRIACPGFSDVGDWTAHCVDVHADSEADAQAECYDMTDPHSNCDETGCCYETSYQAVELIAGGC